ncbi:MAG: 50S ribosomal protein L25 [Bryobacteraceae bacterium]|nr:50S ribosomal protein L25 [Bryobacteraceae bacterium]
MRKDITVVAEPRLVRGKNEMNRLRVKGMNPAVIYGAGVDSVAVSVNPKDLHKILYSGTGHNTIFNVAVTGGETTPVMMVDWQMDPILGTMLHADLLRIDLAKRIRVKVPVHTTGDPMGVKIQGGQYEIINREIEIRCLPDDVPEVYEVNVSSMAINGALRAADIVLKEGTELVSDPRMVLSHVVSTRTSDEAAAAAAAAEPEVIKKGKKEEAGAAPAKAGAAPAKAAAPAAKAPAAKKK